MQKSREGSRLLNRRMHRSLFNRRQLLSGCFNEAAKFGFNASSFILLVDAGLHAFVNEAENVVEFSFSCSSILFAH